ncbi:hypothetical protein KIL84_022983 [Mauremys mutica]|uniref:Uncharacterized protein n=1 Tax=Mauremys mutica TaxID=74926 RepID=A0A9D3WP90_9SAUR|nr:hypothetical protein KIL84_022983 [Mauremys mutica]
MSVSKGERARPQAGPNATGSRFGKTGECAKRTFVMAAPYAPAPDHNGTHSVTPAAWILTLPPNSRWRGAPLFSPKLVQQRAWPKPLARLAPVRRSCSPVCWPPAPRFV